MNEVDLLRSDIMRAVRSKDTKPELTVRRLIHGMGYRYRLHRSDLPGKPDIVFPSKKAVIFVHGCYWHGHSCSRGARIPKTNTDYWKNKIAGNVERDKKNIDKLRSLGWRVLVIWECKIKKTKLDQLRVKVCEFLSEKN